MRRENPTGVIHVPPAPPPQPLMQTFPVASESGLAMDDGLGHHFRILLAHWLQISTVTIAVTLATLAWLIKTQPVFEASARVQVSVDAPDYATLKDSATSALDDTELVNTYVAVIEGDSLARATIAKYGLEMVPEFAGSRTPARIEDVVRTFENHLNVRRVPETRLVEITFASTDPTLAANVANALANGLITFELQQNFDSATKATSWLDTELKTLQGQVEQADQAVVDYQEKNDIVNVDDRQTITTQKLSQLSQSLTSAIEDRIEKQAAVQALQHSPDGVTGLPQEASDPLLPQLRQRRAEVESDLALLRTQFGPNYPNVKQLVQQVAALDSAIRAEQDRLSKRLQQSYLSALDREKLLTAAVNQQTEVFNSLSQKSVQYLILKGQAASKHQLYDGLLQKQREASVTAGITSSHVTIVDAASVPLRPARPKRVLDLAMGVLAGLVLGSLFVVGREQWDRTVRTPDDLDRLGARPLIGVVPRFTPDRDSTAAALGQRRILRIRGVELDAYRTIRTALQLSVGSQGSSSIAVSSPLPGEGKSTCVANLAHAYSQTGQRVLIVDADLRRPSQHIGFDCPRSPGLSEVLLGEVGLERATVPVGASGLHLLPAGRRISNPSELLQSPAFAELMKTLPEHFDRILIDCTPLLGLPDGVLGISQADMQIIITRCKSTPKSALRRVLVMCRQVNLEPTGFVLNSFNADSAYGDGYGYYGYASAYRDYHGATEAEELPASLPTTQS